MSRHLPQDLICIKQRVETEVLKFNRYTGFNNAKKKLNIFFIQTID
jgi:hypothetical protein